MFGFIEAIKTSNVLSIQEYSIAQTSLEMIFNYFAKGGKSSKNIDNEINEANGGYTNQATYLLINDMMRCQRFEKGVLKTSNMSIKANTFKNFKSPGEVK